MDLYRGGGHYGFCFGEVGSPVIADNEYYTGLGTKTPPSPTTTQNESSV